MLELRRTVDSEDLGEAGATAANENLRVSDEPECDELGFMAGTARLEWRLAGCC